MKKRGLHTITLCTIMLVTIIIIGGFIAYSNVELKKCYNKLTDAEEHYRNCMIYSQMIQDASDNLTKQCWKYAETGNSKYYRAYFKESDSQRREKALMSFSSSDTTYSSLIHAKKLSDELMEMEYHIMRLAAEANKVDISELRPEISSYVLTSDEMNLTREKKQALARNIAFGESYRIKKDEIDSEIKNFSQAMLEKEKTVTEKLKQSVIRYFFVQQLLIIAMIVIVAAVSWLFYTQVILVLKSYNISIIDDAPLNEDGAIELRNLAKVYNILYERKKSKENALQLRADMDALSGVLNRGSFQSIVNGLLSCTDKPKCCFLLIDIDFFKSINDKFGHDTGDCVIQNIAYQIRESFRAEDITARIGGDEFAVMIQGVSQKNAVNIVNQIDRINNRIGGGNNDMPPVSISCGIAFSIAEDNFEAIYKRADTALYAAKKNGRHGCCIYNESMKPIDYQKPEE